jgi:two-component system cell cycle response regulator
MNDQFIPKDTTILIVDDKPENRELLQQRLERGGYEFVLASDGEEALILTTGLLPDLILLDVMMPGIDGFEVCRRIRSNPATREIPVIMITALHDTASRIKGIEVGADDFLAKPVDLMELETRVSSIARLGRYRRLMAERAKFELFARHSRDACIITDDDGKVTFLNPRAESLLPGMEVAAPLAQAVLDAGYRVAPKDIWQNALPDEEVVNLVRRCDDGILQWLRLEHHQPDTSVPNEHFFSLTDVTPQIDQRKRFWSFHTVLAHKFRTPITGILGSMELLQMGDLDKDGTLIKGLHSSATRLRQQIENVLRYVERANLADGPPATVEQALAIFRQTSDQAQTTACLDIGKGLEHTTLPLTTNAIEVIFTELIQNAVKFHPEHQPELALRIARPSPDTCAITLTDNGAHIPESKLKAIIRPYYQAEEFFTGEVPGMGLGLAMISILAAEQGGHLDVRNRADGPGVEVDIHLPISKH